VLTGTLPSANGWWFKFADDKRKIPSSYGFDLIRQKRDIKVYATHLLAGEKREFRNCTVADTELGIYKGAAAAVALSASGHRGSQ
jgi:hypothetical protein